MATMPLRWRCCAAVSLIMTFLGCGGSGAPAMAKVSGVVTYQGKPLSDANISFVPESGPIASGLTDAEGKFSLSIRGTPGAVLGEHRISITAFKPVTPSPGNKPSAAGSEDLNPAKPVSRIPEKYGSPETSGLSAVVVKQRTPNNFQFDLN
ncbi:carboxypeptidase regulatory-like domain-containing protein [Planctomicrobium sp. SH661]|uniref:carboxypeptidase regulatory-like domain-containing protein n=1 Tax=Planctomicrobium sp. SH661 TaxID=3448124 RepID=UPI003F5B39EB